MSIIYIGETNLSRNRNARAQKRQENLNNTIHFTQPIRSKPRTPNILPKTLNQENFYLQLSDSKQYIVIASGPAGTGKTYMAMQAAVRSLQNNSCDKIIMTRPAVGVEDEQHGFLPGNLVSKMEPWTRPLFDVLKEYYRPQEIASMLENQVLEISPLAYMRGRTFKNAWIIADEMQNATPEQMKMLMSRIGTSSKIVITGDVEQTDRSNSKNGLRDILTRLTDHPVKGISLCQFNAKDIQRHPIIGEVLKLYSS
jgi:phosphate starvation-inducible PhoH-like protein